MQLNGLKLSGELEDYSFILQFFGSKMQKTNFEENKGFKRSFLRIEVQVISNPSTRLMCASVYMCLVVTCWEKG